MSKQSTFSSFILLFGVYFTSIHPSYVEDKQQPLHKWSDNRNFISSEGIISLLNFKPWPFAISNKEGLNILFIEVKIFSIGFIDILLSWSTFIWSIVLWESDVEISEFDWFRTMMTTIPSSVKDAVLWLWTFGNNFDFFRLWLFQHYFSVFFLSFTFRRMS